MALACDEYNMSDFKCTVKNPIKEKVYKTVIKFPYVFILYYNILEHLYIYNMETQTMKIISYDDNILSFYILDDLQFIIIAFRNHTIIHNLLNGNKTVLNSIKVNINDECYITNNFLIYTNNTVISNKKCICVCDIISGEIIFKKYISINIDIFSSSNNSVLFGRNYESNVSCIFHLSLMEKNKIRMINIPGIRNDRFHDMFIKNNKYTVLTSSRGYSIDNNYFVKTTYDNTTRKFNRKKVVIINKDYLIYMCKILFSQNGEYFYVFYNGYNIVELWNTKTMNISKIFELMYHFEVDSYYISISKDNNIIYKNNDKIIKNYTPFSIIEWLKINTRILPNELWNHILVLI